MLRILFCSSNPIGTQPLNLTGEYRALEDRLRTDGRSACVELRHIPGGTFDAIEREIRSFRPNVLHFSGHGAPTSLQVEGSAREELSMPPAALGTLLKLLGSDTCCLVLNACHSSTQAQALLSYVPCVVGMRGPVADSTAIRFSTSFYAALAAGDPLGRAFALAQNSAYATSLPGPETPAFYERPGAGALPLLHKVKVFCLHSPQERGAYEDLRKSLAIYRRAGLLELTGSGDSPAQGDAERFTEDQLDAANLIVALGSDEFIADDRCAELTLRALRRYEAKQAVVLGIVVRDCEWAATPLGHLLPLPRSGAALTSANRDGWWKDVTSELVTVLRAQDKSVLHARWEQVMQAPAPLPG